MIHCVFASSFASLDCDFELSELTSSSQTRNVYAVTLSQKHYIIEQQHIAYDSTITL